MSNMIRKIALTQTYLNENEIEKIVEVSKSLDLMANFYEADVFIDVLSKVDDEAIVVAHSKYKVNSLYRENVIGQRALIGNEPGVISCLKTGKISKDIKALTQEYKVVKQNIQPITLDDKVIAALIVEKDISIEVKDEFDTHKDEKKNNSHQFIKLIKNNDFLVDNLNSSILIFDKKGRLKIKNRNAVEMYKNIGFECDIQDMHYNELYIENKKFEDILLDENYNEINEVSFEEGTENYDFNQVIKATDLSNVDLQYDTTSLDVNKAGDYQIKALAKDSFGNQTEKEITVHVKAKPKQELSAAKVYHGGGKVICIDAGHQGRGNSSLEPNGPGSSTMKAKVTSGATGCVTGKTESQINLEVALKLQQVLVKQGYTVVMCRTSQNVDLSNVQRAEIANEANAAAFIRLHCDSSESSSPTGTLTLAPSTSNKYCASIASQSQALSKSIVNNICKVTGSRNRGVSIVDNMTGLNWSKVPVTIVEMGFLSNPGEDRLLSSEDYQNKIVQGIVNGIGEYLS